jgi:predicted nucleotidyltransferase
MLELHQIDLNDLAEALEDHSEWHSWWLDPRSGTIELWAEDALGDEGTQPGGLGWVAVEQIESREGYGDMVEFVEAVSDPRAHDLLARAIEGRGAFRRFKDTLLEFPELRGSWLEFHRVRMERRAIAWLFDTGLIERAEAERGIEARPDPQLPRRVDPRAIAKAVAVELATIYGERLRDVRLYGSWARGDAHLESDIDLLVVLDRVHSRWAERRRVEDVLWKHSFENDVIVSAFPVAEAELRRQTSPFMRRVQAEAVSLT